MIKPRVFTVLREERGQTLLSFLRTHFLEAPSTKAIKRAIDEKHCMVNDRVEWFSTYPVQPGDKISITLDEKPKKLPLTILYEDTDLIVYNKPPGISSDKLSKYILVHRLDKDTSGVILFAKNKRVSERLVEQFRKRTVQKTYLVICDGRVKKEKWTADTYMAKKVSYQGGGLWGSVRKKEGKRAITHFERIATSEEASLLKVHLETGRTHQIRVHLKEAGHPVLGDWQYAHSFRCNYKPLRQLLHAHTLAFIHPATGDELFIEAELSDQFFEAKKKLFPS